MGTRLSDPGLGANNPAFPAGQTSSFGAPIPVIPLGLGDRHGPIWAPHTQSFANGIGTRRMSLADFVGWLPGRRWRQSTTPNGATPMCQSHGLQAGFENEAWTCSSRTPPYYPDAITLVPNPSVPHLLSRIDASVGCSIKDSFASLDLYSYGFRVLFDAQWITRTSNGPQHSEGENQCWGLVRDVDDLASWEQAWRRGDGPTGIFRAELLDNDSVAILAARNGDRIVAGAVLNRSSMVVGISNFFANSGVDSASRSGCLTFAEWLFPAARFVGYESGDGLGAIRSNGFDTAGPLRVWILES